jgi:sugar lactone lactonase YvrE
MRILPLGTVLLASASFTCSADLPDATSTHQASIVDDAHAAHAVTFTTVYKAPFATEGLTSDAAGNLYTAGRAGSACPVWRIASADGAVAIVGTIPAACSPNGLAFDAAGLLYVTDGADKIYRFAPDATAPPAATLFASGAPGANGIAFDRRGNLWAADGGTGQGRIFRIAPDATVTEAFRVQPLANDVNAAVVGGVEVGGIGRDPRALPPGTITFTAATRAANDKLGSVPIVANGIAFDLDGDTMFIADPARGAIWRARIDRHGDVVSPVGCDTTFAPDTLCLEDLLVEHPFLEGVDGIALDLEGNIWGTANERTALVEVTRDGAVREVFRNAPDPTTQLRNNGPLEFPTSPVLVGRRLCIAQTDVSRRDNFPSTGGEVGAPTPFLGKVSCADQLLAVPGLRLPLR